jgi:hypothetical protein
MVRTLEFEVTDAELHAALGEFERRQRSELDYRAFLSLLGRLRRTPDVVREADLKQLLQLFEEDTNPGYVRQLSSQRLLHRDDSSCLKSTDSSFCHRLPCRPMPPMKCRLFSKICAKS